MRSRAYGSIRAATAMSIEPTYNRFERPTPPPAKPVPDRDEQLAQPAAAAQQEPVAEKAKRVDPQDVIEAASRAYEQMRESARVLQFEATDTGFRIEVYDANGKLVRSIPPNEQLAQSIARGAAWQA
jgi:hypothetical protein